MLAISQEKLAGTVGLTFQQVHKYEQGKSRISAGRLYKLAKALGVPVAFFFEGMAGSSSAVPVVSDGDTDSLNRREAIDLFRAYRAISNPAVRRGLRQLAKALGPEPNDSTAPKLAPSQSRTSRRVRTDRGRGGAADR
jgi:transcriptional regulator with XRE-family HTH domain